jgi:hypothetical protein
VAPLGLFNRSRTFSVLVPWRAPDSLFAGFAALAALAGFLAGMVFLPDLALADATRDFRGAAFGFGVSARPFQPPLFAGTLCSSPSATEAINARDVSPFAEPRHGR